MRPDFRELGAEIVAVSPQTPEYNAKTRGDWKIDFEILADTALDYSHQLGLRHGFSPELRSVYESFGIDLATVNGNDDWTLPIPARYVVTPDGVIQDARVDADYTRRPEPSETLEVVRELG